MSTISEPGFYPFAGVEIEWDEVTRVETRAQSFLAASGWRPAVNAYRCPDKFVVFVDLPGVPRESFNWSATNRRLVIRGERPTPEPGCQRSDLAQLLALEMDHGFFERVLELPQDIDPTGITINHRDGVYQMNLPLAG